MQHSNGHCVERARIGYGAGSGVANRTGRASTHSRRAGHSDPDVVPPSQPANHAEDKRLTAVGAHRIAGTAQGPDSPWPAAERQQAEDTRRLIQSIQQLPVRSWLEQAERLEHKRVFERYVT